MREANDRGYECMMLEDCCGATDYDNHLAAIIARPTRWNSGK